MLQHYCHEYTRATSLTFPNTDDVFEVPLMMAAECQGRRGKLLD